MRFLIRSRPRPVLAGFAAAAAAIAVAVPAAASASTASAATVVSPVVGHVYVNDNTAGVNTVAGFQRNAGGTLTALAGSPFAGDPSRPSLLILSLRPLSVLCGLCVFRQRGLFASFE